MKKIYIVVEGLYSIDTVIHGVFNSRKAAEASARVIEETETFCGELTVIERDLNIHTQ